MKYIIDTHVFIWYSEGINKVSPKVIDIIENPNNKIIISTVSLWEITIKESLKKLNISIKTKDMENILKQNNIEILDFNLLKDLKILSELPFYHRIHLIE